MSTARVPRFRRIVLTGGVLGVVVGLLVSLLSGPATGYGHLAGAGYLGLAGLFVGLVLGAAVAALLAGRPPRRDRRGAVTPAAEATDPASSTGSERKPS